MCVYVADTAPATQQAAKEPSAATGWENPHQEWRPGPVQDSQVIKGWFRMVFLGPESSTSDIVFGIEISISIPLFSFTTASKSSSILHLYGQKIKPGYALLVVFSYHGWSSSRLEWRGPMSQCVQPTSTIHLEYNIPQYIDSTQRLQWYPNVFSDWQSYIKHHGAKVVPSSVHISIIYL